MSIDGRVFGDKSIDVGDADHYFDVAIGQALGNLDLVEIFRCIVVDRRPKQIAQITHLVGRRELWRAGANISQLFLSLRREIRLKTMRLHDLLRDRGKVDGRRPRIVHPVEANTNPSWTLTPKEVVDFPSDLRAPGG